MNSNVSEYHSSTKDYLDLSEDTVNISYIRDYRKSHSSVLISKPMSVTHETEPAIREDLYKSPLEYETKLCYFGGNLIKTITKSTKK